MTRDDALDFVLESEGGWYSGNRPGDPNPTHRGITLRTLQGLGSAGDLDGDGDVDVHDLRGLTAPQARAIYTGLYWTPAGCDPLFLISGKLAAAHFDTAVNCGVPQALKLLQRAVDVRDDGLWGPHTEAAVKLSLARHGELGTCQRLLGLRIQFYQDLVQARPAKVEFLDGWRNRVNDLGHRLGLATMWPDNDPPRRAA